MVSPGGRCRTAFPARTAWAGSRSSLPPQDGGVNLQVGLKLDERGGRAWNFGEMVSVDCGDDDVARQPLVRSLSEQDFWVSLWWSLYLDAAAYAFVP